MSFSFPHLVWIFQKAFSGLSYFETLIWLMIDVVTIGLLPLGLLDVHRFRVWRAALWEILSFLLLLPHCHSQLGHHYLTYLKQWSAVLRICYTWWMMIFSNTTDPSAWFPSLSLWHILPYILQPLWNLDTVPLQLSCHYSWSKFTSTHTLEGGIITTVFIIFLHIEIASQSLHAHSHILLLDISLLYCFTLHTNYSACLASKYCWAVNIMLLKLIFSNNVRSLLVYVRVQLPEASTPPAFYDYITIRPRRPISWVHFICNVDFNIVRCWLI